MKGLAPSRFDAVEGALGLECFRSIDLRPTPSQLVKQNEHNVPAVNRHPRLAELKE
jgi:hypothetical protein